MIIRKRDNTFHHWIIDLYLSPLSSRVCNCVVNSFYVRQPQCPEETSDFFQENCQHSQLRLQSNAPLHTFGYNFPQMYRFWLPTYKTVTSGFKLTTSVLVLRSNWYSSSNNSTSFLIRKGISISKKKKWQKDSNNCTHRAITYNVCRSY